MDMRNACNILVKRPEGNKTRVFWDIPPCSLVGKKTDVSEVHTACIIRVMIEAVLTSETSVYSNNTTRRYIP
jgi:hypothetical protein